MRLIFSWILSLLSFAVLAGINMDSLKAVLNNAANPLAKIDALNALAWELKTSNPDSTIILSVQSNKLSKENNYDLGEAESKLAEGNANLTLTRFSDAQKILQNSLNLLLKINVSGKYDNKRVKMLLGNNFNALGNVYYSQGDFISSLRCNQNALKIRTQINDKAGLASSYNNIALILAMQGDYKNALKNHFASLKLKESLGNKRGAAISYNNIGLIYKDHGESEKALVYLNKSIKNAKETGMMNVVAICYVNIGAIYTETKKFNDAASHLDKAKQMAEQIQNPEALSNALGNFGVLYMEQGKYDLALENVMKAVEIKRSIGDKLGECSFLNSASNIYKKMGNMNKAVEYGELSLELARKNQNLNQILQSSGTLSDLYHQKKNYEKAFQLQELHYLMRDSILNTQNTLELLRQEVSYTYEKQAMADSLNYLANKKVTEAANQEKFRSEKIKRLVLGVGLVASLILALLIFNRFRIAKKQKHIIEIQSKRLEETHRNLELTTKEIQDSILYSKEIQNAFLRSPTVSEKYINDALLVYRPKDIVSGDFYWYKEIDDVLFAVVGDSTGHGVPGAIISVLAIQSLEKLIDKLRDRSELHILNELLKREFNNYYERNDHVSIGLDYSIISINKKLNKIYISGSGATVFVKNRKHELEINKFDNINIGGAMPAIYKPTTCIYEYDRVGSIYMFTDGIVDQKGEKTGKKYGSKRLKELILSINTSDPKEALKVIESSIDEWKGNAAQLDDMTLLAIQISNE